MFIVNYGTPIPVTGKEWGIKALGYRDRCFRTYCFLSMHIAKFDVSGRCRAQIRVLVHEIQRRNSDDTGNCNVCFRVSCN